MKQNVRHYSFSINKTCRGVISYVNFQNMVININKKRFKCKKVLIYHVFLCCYRIHSEQQLYRSSESGIYFEKYSLQQKYSKFYCIWHIFKVSTIVGVCVCCRRKICKSFIPVSLKNILSQSCIFPCRIYVLLNFLKTKRLCGATIRFFVSDYRVYEV